MVPRPRKSLLLIILLIVVGAGYLLWNHAAARRDTARDAGVRQIQSLALANRAQFQSFPPELPPDAPKAPARGTPYKYKAGDNDFVVCATFERRHGLAMFATASGTFQAPARFCRTTVDPRIATIATDIKITDLGARLFLTADPTIVDKATIKDKCKQGSDAVAIYGCFDEQGKIWVLNITDPDLAGVSEVTAAHELVHAYQVGTRPDAAALDQAAAKLADPELNDELANYQPDERTDELDARLGTEAAGLPADLVARYDKIFDQQTVVAKYGPYRDILNNLRSLKNQIDASTKRLDSLKASGQIGQYNSDVAVHNDMVDRYNVLADRYNLLTE